MAKLEESELKLLAANRTNADLQRTNQSLTKENQILKSRLQEIDVQHQLELLKRNKSSTDDFSEVEFKLAETRAKLARSQQVFLKEVIMKSAHTMFAGLRRCYNYKRRIGKGLRV